MMQTKDILTTPMNCNAIFVFNAMHHASVLIFLDRGIQKPELRKHLQEHV